MGHQLKVWLLGEFKVEFDNLHIQSLDMPRLQSLLAYLILHREKLISKNQLASLLWPDVNETQARTNLRRLVFRLRQAWNGFNDYVTSTDQTFSWNLDLPFWCDALEFQQLVEKGQQTLSAEDRSHLLESAIRLYKGDLFLDCYEDWIIPFREESQRFFLIAIEALIQITEARGDYRGAIGYAEQLRRRDALYEPVYLTLMRLHLKNGNRAGAIEVYQACAASLREELDVAPGDEIKALYLDILHLETIGSCHAPAEEFLPFVGRDQEWDRLRECWLRAANTPRMFIIKGETGIGKSRLADEFAKWIKTQGVEVGSTSCYPGEESTAYAALGNWLRGPYQKQKAGLGPARLRELARILPEILSDFSQIEPPPPMTESWQRLQFFDALGSILLPTSPRRPLLLVIDDLQWCDRETLEWLQYLTHQDPEQPLLMIGTCRVEEWVHHSALDQFTHRLHSEGKIDEIELGGLNQPATGSLAAQLLNRSLDQPSIERLYRDTSGNPLYIVEVVHAWASHQPALSDRLQGMIAARLDQLSEPELEVIQAAAVIGRDFTWELLSIIPQIPNQQLVDALDDLFEKRILQEKHTGAYDFAHDQFREVAYNHIPVPHRRSLHRKVAEAILQVSVQAGSTSEHWININAAQIAAHYEKAGSIYQAFQYYARAAEYAAKIYAHQESEALFANAIRLALSLSWPGPELARLYAARGRALEHLGRFQEAIQVYSELEALAGERNDLEMQCIALVRTAACFTEPSGVHNPAAARPLLTKGLALARTIGAHELEAQTLWSLLLNASHYGNPEEGREPAEACLAVARAYDLKDILAVCLHDYALNLRLSGDTAYGTACAEEARSIFRSNGNLAMLADSLNQQALIDLTQLQFQAAHEYVLEARQLSLSIRNNWNLAYASWLQAMIHEAQGKWITALRFCEESFEVGQECGFLMSLTSVRLLHGNLLRSLGQVDRAIQLHQAAMVSCESQASFLLFASQAQIALDQFALGDLKSGEKYLRAALAQDLVGVIGPCIGLPSISRALAEWAACSGEWLTAAARIRRFLDEIQRRDLPYDRVQACYDYGCCLAGAGQLEEAEAIFLSLLPELDKSQFHRLHYQVDIALAAHYERLNNQEKKQAFLLSAEREKSFLQ